MVDHFFKVLTSLRNCNLASSPALRLGGASEQLSSLCLQNSARGLTTHDHDPSSLRRLFLNRHLLQLGVPKFVKSAADKKVN